MWLLATTSVIGSVNEENKKREFSPPTTISFIISLAAWASSAYISSILASFGLPSEDEIADYVQKGTTGAAAAFGVISYIFSHLQCGFFSCRCCVSDSFSPRFQLSESVIDGQSIEIGISEVSVMHR